MNASLKHNFRFLAQSNVHIENGAFRSLPNFLREQGYTDPTIIVDEGFGSSPLWLDVKTILSQMDGCHVKYEYLPGGAEPTYDSLRQTVEKIRQKKQDVLVGVGGGSCMDTTKAVAALLTNPGDPLQYRGFDKLNHPGIPTILIPTTAGTGSEASYNASFVDADSKRKMGINGRYMFAQYSILDGETTLSCPYRSALSAAVDALVHTLEGFVCKQRNLITDMLAKKAFALIVNALPSLKNDTTNVDRRLELLIGAYLGGLIQMNSGSGVAAAISYPLSVYYKVPHGIGGGMFCLEVMRFNIESGFYLYSELASLIGIEQANASAKKNALAVLHYLENLWMELDVPKNLMGFGIAPHDFQEVLKTMHTQQPGFDQNPIVFTVADHLPKLLKPFFKINSQETISA